MILNEYNNHMTIYKACDSNHSLQLLKFLA